MKFSFSVMALTFSLCSSVRADESGDFASYRNRELLPFVPEYERISSALEGHRALALFRVRMDLIDDLNIDLVKSFLARVDNGASEQNTTVKSSETILSPGEILSKYHEKFARELPLPSLSEDDIKALREYYNAAVSVSSGYIAERSRVVLLPQLEEFIWLDDGLPKGANGTNAKTRRGTWEFVSGEEHPPFSGDLSVRLNADGLSQNLFRDARHGLRIEGLDQLFVHVWLDRDNPPKALMVQYRVNGGTWNHRVYWGEDLIRFKPSVRKGPLPEVDNWVRLAIDSQELGLNVGDLVDGLALVQFDGTAYWDGAGIVRRSRGRASQEEVWFEDEVPEQKKAWQFVDSPGQPVFSGTSSVKMQGDGLSQSKCRTPYGLAVGGGDTLFTHVYLDPESAPKSLMLQYYSQGSGWNHRAYWGEERIKAKPAVRIGALPQPGRWVRLEIEAQKIGLVAGSLIRGLSFDQFDGTAHWDGAGIVRNLHKRILELCVVVPFLHCSDEEWSLKRIEALPGWMTDHRSDLLHLEGFSLRVRRTFTAYQFGRFKETAHQGKGTDYLDYLDSATDRMLQTGETHTALHCLSVAAERAESIQSSERTVQFRIRRAQLLDQLGQPRLADAEVKRCLPAAGDSAEYGHLVTLHLKYLYKAKAFEEIITEAPKHMKDERLSGYWPIVMYMQWLSCRQVESEVKRADRLQKEFLERFPGHRFAANMHFSSAMSQLAAFNYSEADRLLEIIELRYPDSEVASKARDLHSRIRRANEKLRVHSK